MELGSWMPTSSSALVFRPHHQPKTFTAMTLAYVVDPSASRLADVLSLAVFGSLLLVSAEVAMLKPPLLSNRAKLLAIELPP